MTKYRIVRDKSWHTKPWRYRAERWEKLPFGLEGGNWWLVELTFTKWGARRAIEKDIEKRKYKPEIIEELEA